MGSFGENLRREREMRGVSLEEIASATKISVSLLQAIESENFAKLPGGIFARSFIRSYARYLGLEEEPVLAEFEQVAREQRDIEPTRFTPPGPTLEKKHPLRTAFWTSVAAVFLLGAGYELFRYSRQRLAASANSAPVPMPVHRPAATVTRSGAPNPTAPSTGSAPANTQALSGATSETSNSATETAGSAQAQTNGAAAQSNPAAATSSSESALPAVKENAPTGSGTGLLLQIAATERSWVTVDADGTTVLQGVLEPNTVKTLKAAKSFSLITGNAQGIILTLNGETLKPLGRFGEVKSVHLTRASLKNP